MHHQASWLPDCEVQIPHTSKTFHPKHKFWNRKKLQLQKPGPPQKSHCRGPTQPTSSEAGARPGPEVLTFAVHSCHLAALGTLMSPGCWRHPRGRHIGVLPTGNRGWSLVARALRSFFGGVDGSLQSPKPARGRRRAAGERHSRPGISTGVGVRSVQGPHRRDSSWLAKCTKAWGDLPWPAQERHGSVRGRQSRAVSLLRNPRPPVQPVQAAWPNRTKRRHAVAKMPAHTRCDAIFPGCSAGLVPCLKVPL